MEVPVLIIGNSEADGYVNRLIREVKNLPFDQATHFLGKHDAALLIGLRQGEHELISSVTALQIRGAAASHHQSSQALQHPIATAMAIHVVDLFVSIDIKHQAAETVSMAPATSELQIQLRAEMVSIAQTGQVIGMSLLNEFLQVLFVFYPLPLFRQSWSVGRLVAPSDPESKRSNRPSLS